MSKVASEIILNKKFDNNKRRGAVLRFKILHKSNRMNTAPIFIFKPRICAYFSKGYTLTASELMRDKKQAKLPQG